MSPATKNSLVAVGALALVGLFAGRALRPRRVRRNPRGRRQRENPWVTLKNRHRVLIDDEGRIQAGQLPRAWQGAHVGDVAELGRRWREIDVEEEKCAKGGGGRGRQTFATNKEGIRALLDANPKLEEFFELESKGPKEWAYREWARRGRRGKKPGRHSKGDGRFDALNEGLNLKGARMIGTWYEALERTVPPSRRWEDFAGRLELLEDATGLRLNLPAPAEELELGGTRGQECEQLGEGARGRLLDQARAGRLVVEDLGDVPF